MLGGKNDLAIKVRWKGGVGHCIDTHLSPKFCSKLGACILFRNTIQSFKFSLNDAILDAWKTCCIVPKVFYFTFFWSGR